MRHIGPEKREPIIQLTGIHHLTAVTADAPGNNRFYTQVMGMRRVKKTVNQDDVSAYHLFFADGAGSAGTDLTFFDWPVGPEQRGTDAIVRTALRVSGAAALADWAARLGQAGVAHGRAREVDGRLQLDFEDPEGQRLALVGTGGGSPDVFDFTLPGTPVLLAGDPSFTEVEPAWSPDGTALYFVTGQRTEAGQVARVDLVPRAPRFREDQFRDLFGPATPAQPGTPQPVTPADSAGRRPARDAGRALRVARAVESGNLSVNSNSSVRVSTPFGGFKQSGVGRELGPHALEHYSEVKTVFVSTEG